MTRRNIVVAISLVFGLALTAHAAEPQLAHVVYFKLNESSQPNREKLVAGCRQYLSGHEGTVYFAVGTLAEELSREVNDKDFDVSLIVVFRTKAAHDVYQEHPRHLKFIEEYQDLWSGVRVFDSLIPVAAERDVVRRRLPLPDPAANFAGLIRGTVTRKLDRGIVVKISGVPKQWKQSGAKEAEALVGKSVVVTPGENQNARRLIRLLQPGNEVTLDVAHKSGETLTILELTEEQRARVK